MEKLKELLQKIPMDKIKEFSKKFKLPLIIVGALLVAGITVMVLFATHVLCIHEWQNATCTVPQTCYVCDRTQGEALGHTWGKATCTIAQTCSVCGETEGEPLGHTWVDATCTVPKTCSVCKETEGRVVPHTWKAATCKEPKTCEVCNLTSGSANGHTYDKAKNCTEEVKCDVCKDKIKAAGHNWKNATCDKPKTCSNCKKTEGDALGHKVSNGVCSRCNQKIELKVLMYSDSNLDIYYTGVSDNDYGYDAYINFYAENKSSKEWTIQVRDESINGSMVSYTCSSDVAAGKNVRDDMSISYSLYLNDIGVYSADDIETAEFKLHIYNDDTRYDTGFVTIDVVNSKVSVTGGTSSGSTSSSLGDASSSDSGTYTIEDAVVLIKEAGLEGDYDVSIDTTGGVKFIQFIEYVPGSMDAVSSNSDSIAQMEASIDALEKSGITSGDIYYDTYDLLMECRNLRDEMKNTYINMANNIQDMVDYIGVDCQVLYTVVDPAYSYSWNEDSSKADYSGVIVQILDGQFMYSLY